MKTIKKKIVALTALAVVAIGTTGVTVAQATHVAGVGYCDAGCISEWEYYSDEASSNYYNDAHKHYSYVTVGGNNYYSDGGSSYYVNEGSWAYVYHEKSWYQSAACGYYNINGCKPPMSNV